MKIWFWCPCCERAFQGELPEAWRSLRTGLLTVPCPVDCPFPDCGAVARIVMTWRLVRKWGETERGQLLPAVPVAGRRYKVTPVRQPQPVGA